MTKLNQKFGAKNAERNVTEPAKLAAAVPLPRNFRGSARWEMKYSQSSSSPVKNQIIRCSALTFPPLLSSLCEEFKKHFQDYRMSCH